MEMDIFSMSVIKSKEGLVNAGRDHLAGAKYFFFKSCMFRNLPFTY
jgi:hypothetical protein